MNKQHGRQTQKALRIWGVTSGKGGVGKSFVVSSIGISAARMGLKVIIVDFDLKGGNQHTFLGLNPKLANISEWMNDQSKNLNDYIHNTSFPNLKLIMGHVETWGAIKYSDQQMNLLREKISGINADLVILDLGEASSDNELELLNKVDEKVLITTPEPTSIERTYRWVETFLAHHLQAYMSKEQFYTLLAEFKAGRRAGGATGLLSLEKFLQTKGFAIDFKNIFNGARFSVLVNQVRSYEDESLSLAIKSVILKFYGLPTTGIGFLQFDNAVWQCIRKRSPLFLEQPFNAMIGQFLSITKHLVDPTLLKAV